MHVTSLFLCFLLQPQAHKSQPARKLPPKKDMKEQEKGEGSDSKESPKTKSDESGVNKGIQGLAPPSWQVL